MIMVKRSKAQKWAEPFKILAQNMYYRSPKAYNFMRDRLSFELPSKASLIRWQPIKNFSPGTENSFMLEKLKEKINTLTTVGKECCLIFDEIRIRKDLKFNTIRDCINGYVDLGNDCRERKLGSYICVFMVRGVIDNWKSIISYYVSENAISSTILSQLIKTNLDLAFSLGLEVRAVICDQGSNNRRALSNMGATIDNPKLDISSNKIIVGLFDPPHLIKSFRNGLLSSDIETSDGIASWEVIREFYKMEVSSITRMCPKLSDKHINPGHFDKMKVKLASQIFSRSVVAGLKTAYDLNKFPTSLKSKVPPTWLLFEKLDKLFDCLNSKSLYNANPFCSAIQNDENNKVLQFLKGIIPFLKTIKLVNNKKVYSFDGMIQTINGVLILMETLFATNRDVSFLLTSRLNQDALENTFALIRSANGNNVNPSVQEFGFTLSKLLSIKHLTSFTELANCEEDPDINLLDVIREEQLAEEQVASQNDQTINKNVTDEGVLEIEDESISIDFITNGSNTNDATRTTSDQSVRYFVGYLLFKILKKINCSGCSKFLLKDNDFVENPSELLIKHKNYTGENFGRLQAPSELFFNLCLRQIIKFNKFFSEESHILGVKNEILQRLLNSDLEFYSKDHPCYEHRLKLLNFMLTILIRKYCKWELEREKLHKIKVFRKTRTTNRRWRTTLD